MQKFYVFTVQNKVQKYQSSQSADRGTSYAVCHKCICYKSTEVVWTCFST